MRERHALVEAGVGQDLLGLVGALGGVLGVLHRQRHGIAGRLLDVGDVVGDVDVALLDAEVGVAAEDVLDLLLGEPVDLAVEPLLAELGDLGRGGRAPVAESAAERAAAVGLPQADPALVGIGGHDRVERAFEERRRDLVEVAHAVDVGIAHEASRPAATMLMPGSAAQASRSGKASSSFRKVRSPSLWTARSICGLARRKASGWSGTCGPPKTMTMPGLQRLQAAGDLERDAAVPDIGAEADQVGAFSASTASAMRTRL